MDVRVGSMLNDLKSQLEQSAVRVNTLSTMARLGNNALVEKFFKESVTMKLPQSSNPDEPVSNQMQMLQSYIYTCCFWGSRDVLKRIIDITAEHHLNIDLNTRNQNTLWTPLHAATFQEHGPIVMLLLENGADPKLKDTDGWSPIDFASVSDKIWSHFASRNIPRVPLQTLLERGMITKIPDQSVRNGSANSPSHGIPLMNQTRDYDQGSSASSYRSTSSAAAAFSGDVLAADFSANQNRQRNRSNFFY